LAGERAGLVFHHHALTQGLAEFDADQPGDGVVGATGGLRHDDLDGLVLGPRRVDGAGANQSRAEQDGGEQSAPGGARA
jgi:hypothetical protein